MPWNSSLGLGTRVACLGSWISGLGFQVFDLKSRVSGLYFEVLGLRSEVLHLKSPDSAVSAKKSTAPVGRVGSTAQPKSPSPSGEGEQDEPPPFLLYLSI